MNRRHTRRVSLRHDINIAPLVDVMLVLLVVFMMASPTMKSAIHVDLPKERVGKETDAPGACLMIDKGGRLFLSDHPVTSQELINRLRVLPSVLSDGLSIRADRDLSYAQVMKVIALLSKNGFSKVNLVIEDGV